MTGDIRSHLESERADHAYLSREWAGMRRRLVARIESGTSDLKGEPFSLPVSSYTDPERFEAKRRAFRSLPALLHESSPPTPQSAPDDTLRTSA